jgi:hypothetical protein
MGKWSATDTETGWQTLRCCGYSFPDFVGKSPLSADEKLHGLLKTAGLDVASFHEELRLRGHAVHLNTLSRYAGENPSKSAPDWMVAVARDLADRGPKPPSVSPARPAELPRMRTLSCIAPAAVVEAVETLRASDPSKPSEKQVVLQLIERGLASLAPKEAKPRERYACAVCGHISDGRLLEEGSEQTNPSMRFPKRHKGPDGQPCAGNYRYARLV